MEVMVAVHFGLLFGSGTRDLAELWRTKTRMSWISSLVSLYRIFPLLRNAIVIIFSRGVLQPSGIRRFGNGVSQLSPLL